MRNRGIELEKLASEYGFILNDKSNAKATEAPDATDLQGRTHQIKSDRATIANNNNRVLGKDIVTEATSLLIEDYSDMITLIATYAGKTIFYSFFKKDFNEMITDQPEILYYDIASSKNGGNKVIRIKIKKKFDRYYRMYAVKRVEV